MTEFFETNVLYAVLALAALVVIVLLLIYTRQEKGIQARSFRILLGVMAVFCFVDMFWGFIASKRIASTEENFRMASAMFHALAAITAFTWGKFILHYIGVKKHAPLAIFLLIPVLVVMGLLIANHWTGCVFTVDADFRFYSGYLRPVNFVCEGFYFIMVLIVAVIYKAKTTDEFKRERLKTVEIFTVIPLLFFVLQAMFPNAPFDSLGYMISALVVYLGIVSAEQNKKVIDSTEYYKEESKEIYQALEGIAKSFVSVHLFNLELNKQVPVYSNRFIDEFIDEKDGADVQIQKVMAGVCEPEFVDKVVEFVDTHTLSARMRGRRVISCEFLGRNQGWCMSSFIKVAQDEHGNITKAIHAVQNINEIKLREQDYERTIAEAYEDRNVIYSEMLKMQSGGVIATDGMDHVLAINDAAAKMFGFQSSEEAPSDFKMLLARMDFDDYAEAKSDYNKFQNDGEGMTYYFQSRNFRGSKIYVMGVPKKIKMANGREAILTSYTDITHSKEMENRLLLVSQTDALTGISNRGHGEDVTEELLKAGKTGMFCIIDIDKFKSINDNYGHMIGDKALIEVAKALKASFRDKDIVMRLGGDEFAVFAVGITTENAARHCFDRFFEYLEKIDIPELQDNKITVSLGAAFATRTGDRVFDDLYQKADSIMYMCKEKPGNFYAFKV